MSIGTTTPQEHFTREQVFGILNRISFPLDHLPPNTLPEPSLANLQELQTRLVTTIPFETLSLRTTASRGVDLSIEGIYNRVIVQKRGGWCFSLNKLGYELLLALGYRTQYTIGRVCKPIKPDDPVHFSAKTHRISIVRFFDEATGSDTKYVFDIGFGNSVQLPLQLKEGATIEFGGHIRRMTTTTHIEATPEILGNPAHALWCIQEYLPNDDKWIPWYAFSEQQFYENDCEVANFHTCYSPNSVFFKAFWCIRSTPEGEYFLLVDRRIMIKNGKGLVKQIDFNTEQDRLDALREYFDIVLTDEELKYHDSWIVPNEPTPGLIGEAGSFDEASTTIQSAVEQVQDEIKQVNLNDKVEK